MPESMPLGREPLVMEKAPIAAGRRVRIGAVSYLNSRPLVACLPQLAPEAEIVVDLPSRLADGLAGGRFDVALVPSIEFFRHPGRTVVSDACVSCHGRVRSVKLYSRVPAPRIRTLALDEGSRTSAALARILLKERFGLEPDLRALPIGASADECGADAVVLIGDRAIRASDNGYAAVWDLGEEWLRWTGLPFVFAMWIARPGVDLGPVEQVLGRARDEGVQRLVEIARQAAPEVGIPEADCLAYLRDHLGFWLGGQERLGLKTFYRLAVAHQLAPAGIDLVFYHGHAAR